MKWFIFFLSALSVLDLTAQVIKVDKVDEFTKDRIIHTSYSASGASLPKKTDYIDQKAEIAINLNCIIKNGDSTGVWTMGIMFTYTVDFGCLSEYNGHATLLFDSGETLDLMQISKTDCGESSIRSLHSFMGNYLFLQRDMYESNEAMELIGNNVLTAAGASLKKIRVYASKGYHDYTIKPEKANIIGQHIRLISDRMLKP